MLLELAVLNVVIMMTLAALPARQARRPREHRREARNALRAANADRRALGAPAGRLRGGSEGLGPDWLRHPAAVAAAAAAALLMAGGPAPGVGSPAEASAGAGATTPAGGGELWCTLPASETPSPFGPEVPVFELPPIVVPVVAPEPAPRIANLPPIHVEV